MSTDATGNPFREETNLTLATVIDQIEKVVRSPPIKKGDTSTYHIFLSGKEITLTAAQLHRGPGQFCTLYFDAFQKFLFAKKDDWPKFAEFIASNSEEGDIEETTATMAADLIFEDICRFDKTTDKEILTNLDGYGEIMVLHKPHNQPYFVIPSGVVSDMINECPIKSVASDIADAMRAKGYMDGKTRGVKVRGQNIWCWWFLPNALAAHGVDFGELEGDLECR